MGYNKVVINGLSVVDLTGDNVTPDKMLDGVIAHNAKGEAIHGTILSNGEDSVVIDGEYVVIPKGYYPSEVRIKVNVEPPEPGVPDNTILNAAIGTTVKVPDPDGGYNEFIIVHHGLPSELYDASCDGTWLLEKDVVTERVWDGRNDYSDSLVAEWLSATYMVDHFNSSIKSKIKTVKIPFLRSGETFSGQNGFECQAFLPSIMEMGIPLGGKSGMGEDGACLTYFEGTAIDEEPLRTVGSKNRYWTRSSYVLTDDQVFTCAGATGKFSYRDGSYSYGIRPMIIVDSTTILNSDGTIA